MATIKFETGQVVNFEGTPTEADIEEVASSLGITQEDTRQTRSLSPTRPRQLGGALRESITEPFQQAATEIAGAKLRQEQGEQSRLRTGLTAIGQGAQAGFEAVVGAGLNVVSAGIPDFIEDPIRRRVGEGADKFLQSDAGLKVLEGARAIEGKLNELEPKNQQLVKDVFDIALTGLDITATGPVVRTTRRSAQEGILRSRDLLSRATPERIKNLHTGLPIPTRKRAVDTLVSAYEDSFVANRAAISKKLERVARNDSRPGAPVTSNDLIRGLAEEGYVPVVEGKLGKFGDVIDDISLRQTRVASNIDPVLSPNPTRTTLNELKAGADKVLRSSPQVGADLDRSLRELDSFFRSFKTKFGDDLSALEVNAIRKEMNTRTRAFGPDAFRQDTADAVADATRNRIDELVPSGSVRRANAEWGRLQGLKKTATILDNQAIDVGVLGGQLGRYLGVIVASGVGFGAAGPGGLVVAGIAAHYGGDVMAALLRSKRFSKKVRQRVIQELRNDDAIVEQLIQDATSVNAKFLKKELREEPPLTKGVNPSTKVKVTNTIPKELQPLAQEARKFKTAEEFVKAQGKPLFHGSEQSRAIDVEGFKKVPSELVRAFGEGVSLTTKKSDASGFALKGGGVVEAFLPKALKFKKVSDSDAFRVDTKKLISEGFDGVELNLGDRTHFTIFDPSLIKTKSQLTDIFNKVKGGIDESLTPLVKEARKFKTAEEFVEAQQNYLFHGTNEAVLENITKKGLQPGRRGQLSLSKTEEFAKSFAGEGITPTGKTRAIVFRVKPSDLKMKTTLKRIDGKTRPLVDQQNELLTKETIAPELLEISKDGGKTWKNLITGELAKTKQQLTDIFNKAKGQ